jgi:hypothetical protein
LIKQILNNWISILSVIGLSICLCSAYLSPISESIAYGPLIGVFEGLSPIFWLGYVFIIISIFLSFFSRKANNFSYLPFLAFFWVWFITPILRESLPRTQDVWQFLGLAQQIASQGHVPTANVGAAFTAYYQWPGFFIFASVSKMIFGVTLPSVSIMGSIIFSLLFPVFELLAFRRLSANLMTDKFQKFSLFILIITFMLIGAPVFSPQFVSLLLFPLILLLLFRVRTVSDNVVLFLLICAVSIIHPISNIFIISILFALFTIEHIKKGLSILQNNYGYFLLIAIGSFIVISFFGSGPFISGKPYLLAVENFFINLFQGELLGLNGLNSGAAPALGLWYERFARYIPLLLAGGGLIVCFRLQKKTGVFLGAVLLGIFLCTPLVLFTGGHWWDRFFDFAALPISFLGGYLLYIATKKTPKKKMLLVIVFALLVFLTFRPVITYSENIHQYNSSEFAATSFVGENLSGNIILIDYKISTLLYYIDPSIKIVKLFPTGVSGSYEFMMIDHLLINHLNQTLIGENANLVYDSNSVQICNSVK